MGLHPVMPAAERAEVAQQSLMSPLVKTPQAEAIYARISSDVEGTGAGVRRQVEDCQQFASDLGWPVAGEYVDNDISAYSGKRRPAYQRMLEDLADGTVDAVLV
jgi:DNA invertase Pin-like site-specific DNA recombinase